MEKIVIVSDSHKNIEYIERVIDLEKDATKIFHLGDNYSDMEHINSLSKNVTILRVPGLFDPAYSSKKIDNIILAEIYTWKFLLVHDIKDALRKGYDTDFYLYGHTHQWKFEEKWGMFFLNPGHIKSHYDRGNDASYCLLTLNEEKVEINFKHLDGKIFFSKTINNRRKNDN